jgi:ATP-binding cassette subfamily B protein
MTGLRRLLPSFLPYRWRVAFGVACVLGAALLGLATPWLVGRAVDALTMRPEWRTLLLYAGLILGLTAVQGFFSFAQRRTLVAVSRDIEYDLRNEYFAHLETLPAEFYQRHQAGDLMARATNDLQAVRMVCGPVIMYGGHTLFAAAGALVLMARVDWRLTLVALASTPLVAVATRVFGDRIHRLYASVQASFAMLSARAQESFSGARMVRAYAQESREIAGFATLNREYVEGNRRLALWSTAFHPTLQALVGVGFVTVLFYGGLLVRRGEITVGGFVSFNLFLGKLVWPMIAVGWVINLLQRGSASFQRLREILDTVPAIRDTEVARASGQRVPAAPRGELRFAGLRLQYEGRQRPALEDVSFTVPAGSVVAVVGRTGSGKSSLLALLPRLYDPPAGSVFVDDIDVRHWPLARLRETIGTVPQETFLFSATVAENIAYGRPRAARGEVRRAAEAAGLGGDLERFPRGLDTVVGERGVTLSGGQKQRVALARALLRDPKVLLLDDALSAVDTQTESRILAGFRDAVRGRTVLLVSHRLSSVRQADSIVVLAGGRLVEQGRHEELVARGGVYAELDRLQALEEELELVATVGGERGGSHASPD